MESREATEHASGRSRAIQAPHEFLIQTDEGSCRECWGCVRYCPARAIKVIDGKSHIIEERCVKCGLCVSECGACGHLVRDDTDAVRRLLAGPRAVVALLATEFVAALHPLTPIEIERALESVGFFAVESTLLGEEMVAMEYERLLSREGAALTLRSTCPVAVEWVRKFYPQLTSALVTVVPPYIAQARLIREMYPEGTAIVYASPCYARKDEIFDPELAGAVDAAIDFTELSTLMTERRPRTPYVRRGGGGRKPHLLKEMSLTDGFPRRLLEARSRTDTGIVEVRGLRNLDEVLSAVTRGETAPVVIDMLNCEGCIDGPAVNTGLSVFAKRNLVAAEGERAGRSPVRTRDLLGYLPSVETVRSFKATPVITDRPDDEMIDETLRDGGFEDRDAVIDCGACGYRTCVEHAVAVIESRSSWEMCFPQERDRLLAANATLLESATVDALTGLGNRRLFDDRLHQECSRTDRYDSPLSLLMIDVDGFKHVNDVYGHPAGDRVLSGIAGLMRADLREADISTRYGGDEFAILLPATTKTQAYAVAEKLRERVSAQRWEVDEGRVMRATVSIGVASVVHGSCEANALLEAADRALYHAKQEGRDQVRLAPG